MQFVVNFNCVPFHWSVMSFHWTPWGKMWAALSQDVSVHIGYKFWVWGCRNPLNNSNESYRPAHSYIAVYRKGRLNFWWNLLSVIIHMKATHQYNLVQLFIMLYKMSLRMKSPKSYHSSESFWPVLSFGAVFSILRKIKFGKFHSLTRLLYDAKTVSIFSLLFFRCEKFAVNSDNLPKLMIFYILVTYKLLDNVKTLEGENKCGSLEFGGTSIKCILFVF